MSWAAWAPPVTASDPPSHKSLCTSRTMSARSMIASGVVRAWTGSPVAGGGGRSHVDGLAHRLRPRHLLGRRGQLGASTRASVACRGERLGADDQAVPDQLDEERSVVAVGLRRRANAEDLGL